MAHRIRRDLLHVGLSGAGAAAFALPASSTSVVIDSLDERARKKGLRIGSSLSGPR